MIGAGIFVLMGQIAELVGSLFPLALIVGGRCVGKNLHLFEAGGANTSLPSEVRL